MTLPAGFDLQGRYTILSTLGRGSFASVYLARDAARRGGLVAIKEISTEGFSEREYQELNARFLQEAAFLMQLGHPGLPKVEEFFAHGDRYYLAMEWIAGRTLEETVLDLGEVEERQVLGWGLGLCTVLEYLHSRTPYPVVLGDLKPANVMVTYEGEVKLVDFGVARYLAPAGNARSFALVSPGFSPPESYSEQGADLRGDLYSLGATLYWALTRSPLARYRFHIPPLRRLRPGASARLERLLARCLEPAPEARWSSVAELRGQLQALVVPGGEAPLGEEPVQEVAEGEIAAILARLYQDRPRGL